MKSKKVALIIGAGPAGLTAAFELLRQTDVKPVVFEASAELGGISKTVNYKGNRIDIGGHRFFSKSDRVMDWWARFMPIERTAGAAKFTLRYQGSQREMAPNGAGVDPAESDQVMLVRSRLSRIFYLRKFFNYPVKLEWQTIRNLGLRRIVRIGLSYLKARLAPVPEKSLEEFFINRFGYELYSTFFRDYTEKVWGVPCSQIAPDWGAQRIKGLSITETLKHAFRSFLGKRATDLAQKDTATSLIEYFLYPKYGPGQMWETVAQHVIQMGGEVSTRKQVTALQCEGDVVRAVTVEDLETGERTTVEGDYIISTMPINELVSGLRGVVVPDEVRSIAEGLPFRDFITVGLLLKGLAVNSSGSSSENGLIPDNWIYIQEPEVKVGRLQIFNNWSPFMVKDPSTVWIGLEYFVNEGDETWSLSDAEMTELGIRELSSIGIIRTEDVLDSTILRVKKTYPAYFGTYANFDLLRGYLDSFSNLFLIGRNGMHRYNNQDHSMLTAMTAVENIRDGVLTKSNIWDINLEQEYHESK
ncbi:MAG: NAD(P)/FAD-dependent oxidoreductase [Candidatus Eremiobacteraeota bacterium]|nr:NAD(P)/FAD-dependent oxidoreductase [Candidatus Eremiobacteraeota bacterium]MCW5866783.1 NAD(P)/FAD-dependent oxidoreductase [Candidatus Eremiobacteraeota bacterium]